MPFEKAYIPYGGYWSTPYCKWQGSFADLHAVDLAAASVRKFLEKRKLSAESFDNLQFGITIPQPNVFYGGPWLAALLGNDRITGPMVSQACITGVVTVKLASQDVEHGTARTSLVVCADRCSNGPHLYYPQPNAPGATGKAENWVLDNFGFDPYAKNSMLQTAENVATEHGLDREIQDRIAARRYEQYAQAQADDGAFLKRYILPVEVGSGKKARLIAADEGGFPTTLDGLKALKPVLPNGTVTYGTQTHPADGNSGMIVATKERAAELSADPKVTIRFAGFGTSRTKKGHMAAAVVPAAKAALADAGIGFGELKAVKTHNPFAVNDAFFAKETGWAWEDMNNYGCSMVWGHPQAPTALRTLIELIEELQMKGGGWGLFAGCAAGDTAAGLVVKVG